MKKRYLLITILGLVFLTACGNKNTLKCSTEQTDSELGGKAKTTTTIKFDSDTKKATEQDLFMEITFEKEDGAKEIENSKEMYCGFFDGNKGCEINRSGKTVKINIKGIEVDEDYKEKTKDELKKLIEEENKEVKCS